MAAETPASASVARQRSRCSERENASRQPPRRRKASGGHTTRVALSAVKPKPSTTRTITSPGTGRRRLSARKAASATAA